MNEVNEQKNKTLGENKMKKVIVFCLFVIGVFMLPHQIHAEQSQDDVVVFFKISDGYDSKLINDSGNETTVIRKVIPSDEDISHNVPKLKVAEDEKFSEWQVDIKSKNELIYTATFTQKLDIRLKVLIFFYLSIIILLLIIMIVTSSY